MKVFLTGATGFIGQPLTRSFLERGWNVTALVRKPDGPKAQALSKMGAQLTAGDVTERESMRAMMMAADIVVHNAGVYETGMDKAGKMRMQAVNVDGTDNVLGLAHELGIARTLYISTTQAFGDSGLQPCDESFLRQAPCRTTYEQTKTDAHEIALHYKQLGLPLIIACPNGVIGANDQSLWGYFLRLYVNRTLPPMAFSPETIHRFVEINDLVEGIALAAEKGRVGETYFFCGEQHSFRDIFHWWGMKPGAFTPPLWLPVWLASVFFAMMEPLQRMLGLPAFMSGETVRMGATNWNFSTEKAEHELGWTHCSAQEMWFAALDGEIKLLTRHKGQNLIQRLKPLEIVE